MTGRIVSRWRLLSCVVAGLCAATWAGWSIIWRPLPRSSVTVVNVDPDGWQRRPSAHLTFSASDPQGRFITLSREGPTPGSGTELDVFDTRDGRMSVIQGTYLHQPGSVRYVRLYAAQWNGRSLTLHVWHDHPASGASRLARRLSPVRLPSLLHRETWSFDAVCRRAVIIGLPDLLDVEDGRSVSRDSRWRVNWNQGKLMIRDTSGTRVCCAQSLATDGELIPWPFVHWLTKPDELLILDAASVRVLNVRTNTILWSQSTAVLARDVFEYVGPPVSKSPMSTYQDLPGLYSDGQVYHTVDGETSLFCFMKRQPTTKSRLQGAEVWRLHLPSRRWTRLPGRHSNRRAYDPQGRFVIDFREEGDSTVIERFTVDDPGGEALARVPADVEPYARILPNPDRLFWLTKDQHIWMLPLDQPAAPRRVWPPER